MAKSASRKSLKSLFSRSEASLAAPAEQDADRSEAERKKFKFLKLKIKSKKSASENQKVHSAVEPSNDTEDSDAWTDNVVSNNKSSSAYGTAPRSKSNEFSYSESDLRKPKKFATFSFGLKKKRKKKHEDNISKSTFGLHSPDPDEETALDLSQMELAKSNTKVMFSASQPELDTSDVFDIPSPPPVATNRFETNFTLFNQLQPSGDRDAELDAKEPLKNHSDLSDVPQNLQRAPIATIPELQLELSEEKDDENSCKSNSNSFAPTTLTDTTSALDNQAVPVLPSDQRPFVPNTSDHKAAVVDSVSTSNLPYDADILQQSYPKPETSLAISEGAEVKSSCDSTVAATNAESTRLRYTDNSGLNSYSASIPEQISVSERPAPENASVTTSSDVSHGKSTPPVNQDKVYGALYDSLFPQSFTAEVLSSLLNPPPQIGTKMQCIETKLEPVMVKTRDEYHTETNDKYSRLSSSREFESAAIGGSTTRSSPIESYRVTSNQISTDLGPHRNPDIHHRYQQSSIHSTSEPIDSSNITYSELNHSMSKAKSDIFNRAQDNARPFPVVQISAPPVSDYSVTSQGTNSQVTDSIRRVILVKELVTDKVSADAGCPSPVPAEMNKTNSPGLKIETTAPSVEIDGLDGIASPTYLSVGSDDGSAMEIYYSAEEDNAESGDEEMGLFDEREEICLVDRQNDDAFGLCEGFLQQREAEGHQADLRVLIVKNTEKEEKEGVGCGRTEAQPQLRNHSSDAQVHETGMSEFLVANDAESQMKELARQEFPQVKEEGQEERKEELPATPVQQVNTLMVCDFAPPSSEPHGQQEGQEQKWTEKLETEDPPNGEQQLPRWGIEYLADKDSRSSEHIHAAACHATAEDRITPKSREAEEQVLLIMETGGKASKECSETNSNAARSAVIGASGGVEVLAGHLTHSSELTEHKRAPQSGEWVDTITQSTDGIRTVPQKVAVELSDTKTDAHQPSESPEHPAGARLNPIQGSLTTSRTQKEALEVSASENWSAKSDQESVHNMNSGYSSLSTTLFAKNSSSPKEDESKQRFRKVSLISEAEAAVPSQDAVDLSQTSAAATKLNGGEPEYEWKNRFEGVSQYKPYRMKDPHMSSRVPDSYYSTSSFPSALPEPTAYQYHGTAFSSSSLSSPAPEARITPGNRLSDSSDVSARREGEAAGAQADKRRRSLWEWEEPAAPAREGERQREGESERAEARWDAQHFSAPQRDSLDGDEDDSSRFTGVFQATLVELVSDPAAPPTTPPASPDAESPNQFDMDSLVDTLRSMGPSIRPRATGVRPPAPVLMSALPPIVEDAPSPVTLDTPDSLAGLKKKEAAGSNPAESQNGLYTLPPDLGLRSSPRNSLSPLELMKQNQDQPGTRGLNPPLRVTATNSTVTRKSSDLTPVDSQSQVLNENGVLPSSRLDNSVIFGSQRSDQTLENRHRSLFRTSSLPETGLSKDRSLGVKELESGTGTDPPGSRYERFSFLLNTSTSGSLTGAEEPYARMSRSPQSGIGSPTSSSPNRLLSPTGSIDLHRPNIPADSPLSIFGQPQGMGMGVGAGRVSAPILQRSFSSEGTMGVQPFSVHGGPQFQSQEHEPEKNLALKYRAFPDAYLTKEKEHGKLNPRPGKMYIFDRPGMCGQRIEVRGDVIDATPWELQETISIRVIRGGWVLYEKPNFKGEKVALDEGDIELNNPFILPEEQLQNGYQEERQQDGELSEAQADSKPPRRFSIGSIRRAVRDYSVPEISLFPEENAEGKKVIFRDTSDDARIFGFPIKANSIIINAGLWLVFAHPFFQGVPRVLEVGGYSNPEAWGVEKPYVGSLHPLKIGEPRVENTSEPKMIIYDKPYFTGKSRTITTNTRDFMTRTDRQQTTFMYSVGSIKVLGGIWVGYEKEGFRGHQYLLEEGEYHDWRVWGGCDSELRSVRVIRADLTDPLMVMFELPEEEQEGMQEENTFEVKEAIPDVELFEYKTSTRSIHVVSGAWIAYSHVDFSGNQYILEKGFYNNCADWGSQDNRICSVQPILLAPTTGPRIKNEVILYSEPDFQGSCRVFDCNQESLSEKLLTKSCRVSGGSWVFYEEEAFSGNLFVLSEGDYPNITSMGCLPDFAIHSVKAVPTTFSVPSISLFGLECLEGREITTETEILSMVEEGFNNHVLSVRVNSGCWVICEHSNFRGHQFVLEPIEITNWLKFSSLQTVGSMFPVRQKRRFFRIKNKESGHFMSIQGGVEEMKSGRVVVTPEAEPMSDIWFYQDGLLKSKLSPTMSLQVMGNIEPAAKVVLWSETRQPIQTWTAQMTGLISSLTFPGMMLDVKGGKSYDKDHVVIMPENEERPSQQWEIELL